MDDRGLFWFLYFGGLVAVAVACVLREAGLGTNLSLWLAFGGLGVGVLVFGNR